MAITIQYTRTQLESIRYVLKDSWENIVSQVMYSPKSLLRLIDVGKLCRIDTRIIRKDMERARFDELYIASLQNRKRMLSNDRARPRYNRLFIFNYILSSSPFYYYFVSIITPEK